MAISLMRNVDKKILSKCCKYRMKTLLNPFAAYDELRVFICRVFFVSIYRLCLLLAEIPQKMMIKIIVPGVNTTRLRKHCNISDIVPVQLTFVVIDLCINQTVHGPIR
jgi:hypothetical protein